MPANVYECMFLLDTNKVAGNVPVAAQQLHAVFERNHAELLASRPWDERRLAYPVKGHKKGLYYLTYFKAEGKEVVNIERDLTLNETVLRHLILKVDPKFVEIMLNVARDEHALALHTVQEPPEGEAVEGDGEVPLGEEPHGPRRGPHRGNSEERE